MDCPFCDILENKTERIIKETEHSFAILSNPRLMKGHLLVIPKRHAEKMGDLSKEERDDLLDLTVELQEKILKKFCSGCDIRQNYRPFQKQSLFRVNHLHIHLQPREFEDELYQKCQKYESEVFADLEEGEINEMIDLYK